jgi:hypothetical protein
MNGKRRWRLLAGAAIALGLWLPVAGRGMAAATDGDLDTLEIEVVRAEDIRDIRNLQRAYGYFADRGLWDDLADLFAADATANYPSGGFDGNASIRAMFVQNLGQGRQGLAEGRLYNHIILQPVVNLAADGATATGRWRVLGMLGRFGGSATWADSLYRFDYVKHEGRWKIRALTAYAGSGGAYEQGWAAPRPRPPGAADTSPVRFNLAHPADRPWIDPCEGDVSACVVPFPYPNPGTASPPAQVSAVIDSRVQVVGPARAVDLARRAQRLEDEQSVLNLQRSYGYFIDRGLWKDAADLFAPDGSREVGHAGVYIGRERIRQSLALARPQGLRAGELNDHLQLEPVISIAADGQSARGRILELAFVGGGGEPARLVQNIHENEYVRRSGAWMIKALHSYTVLATAYDKGWARSALPAPVASNVLRPDRPPTTVYGVYPEFFTPPFHFANPATGLPTRLAAAVSPAPQRRSDAVALREGAAQREPAGVARQIARVTDYNQIDNLLGAYGYYAEKWLWRELAALFTEDAVLTMDGVRHAGRGRIRRFLDTIGSEGPVRGVLDSQLMLQPVIHVAADGRTAKTRSRVLHFTRDAAGRPMWGSSILESTLVKEDGIWKLSRLQVQRAWNVDYQRGWSAGQAATGQVLPSRRMLPFHYRHPVRRAFTTHGAP